jgi:hypothetical protein
VLHDAESETTTNNRVNTDDDIRLIRERQQELANERAKQATIEMKKKQIQEKERKNMVAKPRPQQRNGDTLGGGNSSDGNRSGYNPLQPLSGSHFR